MATGLRRFVRGSAVLLAGVTLLAATGLQAASAAATPGPAPVHRLNCVRVSGHLYLGDPGATTNPAFVVCSIHVRQVHPRSDGVIVVLRQGRHLSVYSLLKAHFTPPPFGRTRLRWRSHPGPVKIACALAGGRLHLGSTGPRPRTKETCTMRFYQLSPAADGVVAILRTAHHSSRYSVAGETLPHPAIGTTRIRWLS
jgi:hypothetical protein